MAPPDNKKQSRVKGVQIIRPFVMGTTAKPFDPVTNPKPEGIPDDHTHSWTVFVKGLDDKDITYWVKKVQFKLHDSIPNPLRMVEAVPGQPFTLSETGWGEFEITIKLYYVPESNEKPQTTYCFLRLHPYGTELEKANQKTSEIINWCYEEQIFSEPYENFYEILTSQAPQGGKAKKKKMAGGMVGLDRRDAVVPARGSPGQPFSREAEKAEVRRLLEAQKKVEAGRKELLEELKAKEEKLAKLREEARLDAEEEAKSTGAS